MLCNYEILFSHAQTEVKNYDLIIGHDFKAIIVLHESRY